MTQAERIREYFKQHPAASYDEVAEALKIPNGNVRTNVSKDIKAGRCVRLEDKSLDYSMHYIKNEALADLINWKNDTQTGMGRYADKSSRKGNG